LREARSLIWLGATLNDLRGMPDEVQDTIGYALQIAQDGGTAPSVKPLKRFGGANVLEVIENYDR